MDFDTLDFGNFDFENSAFEGYRNEKNNEDLLDDASTSTVDRSSPEILSGDDEGVFDFATPTLESMEAFQACNWDEFSAANFSPLEHSVFSFESAEKKTKVLKRSRAMTKPKLLEKKWASIFESSSTKSAPARKKQRKMGVPTKRKPAPKKKKQPTTKKQKTKALGVTKKNKKRGPLKKQSNIVPESKDDGIVRIGIYTIPERKALLARFREKRLRRIFRKKIKYDCRKRLAQARPRYRGRFVKVSDMPAYLESLKNNTPFVPQPSK